MSFLVRPTVQADVPTLAATYISAFKEIDPSEEWTSARAEALLQFFLRCQPDLAFTAETSQEIVGGICGIVKPWWEGNHLVLSELFVQPSSQQKGIGRALLATLLEHAELKYHVTTMESLTFANTSFPSSWYSRLGFTDKCDWKIIFADISTLRTKLVSSE